MLRALAAPLAILLIVVTGLAGAQHHPPNCRYDDVPAAPAGYDAWARTLLDPAFALPVDYAPPDLVVVDGAGAGEHRVRALMLEDLTALLAAAAAAGNPLEIQSAYRSFHYQARTFAYWVEREGHEAALRSSARPGHSEHQLGTALDFRSAGGPAPWDLDDWGETPAGAWLAANGWRYGFVLSYPAGQEEETCYIYEPWHFRYLGPEVAQRFTESGWTLRAWLWSLQAGP